MTQTSLFDLPLLTARFGGTVEAQDIPRLVGQWNRVWSVMRKGNWYTLGEIHDAIRRDFQKLDSEAGISARLRDFRKPQFGSHTVERRRRSGGLFEYRLAR